MSVCHYSILPLILCIFILYYGDVIVEAQNKIIPPNDTTAPSSFGGSVGISGNYSIVGAYIKDSYRGTAYIYYANISGWHEEAVINASDGNDGDFFGYSVGISNNYAIVGAYGKSNYRGATYIYHHDESGWSESTKLSLSDSQQNDYFGISVAISNHDEHGDYAVISASAKHIVYIYHRNESGWYEDQHMNVGSHSVAISGNYIIMGVHLYTGKLQANIYHLNTTGGWYLDAELIPSDVNISFGFRVAISTTDTDAIAIAGARYTDNNKGAAYIYERRDNIWTNEVKLSASDGNNNDLFGSSVAISTIDQYAIVGANGSHSYRGAIYIYKRHSITEWKEVNKIIGFDSAVSDWFGSSISALNNFTIIGAPNAQTNQGAAYIYLKCEPGSSSTNGLNCIPCEVGYYQSSPFSTSCLLCPIGSYCDSKGLGMPTGNCSIGSYCPEGSTADTPCSAGSFCENTTIIQTCPTGYYCIEGSTYPTLCTLHSYCPSNSSSNSLCPAGYYCENTTTIETCPAGFYCSAGSINANTPCPAGYYCQYGTKMPTACPNGYYCEENSISPSECTTKCPEQAPIEVSKCTSSKDLVCSPSAVIIDSRSFTVPWTLLGLVCAFGIIVIVLSKLMSIKYPDSKSIRLFMFLFAIIDCISDILFIFHVHNTSNKAFVGSLVVLILSILTQGGYLLFLISNWMNMNIEFQRFINEYKLWFGLVFVVSSTNIESILFLSSKCFFLKMLSAPLTHDDELLVERAGTIGVVFETIPQLVIQLLVALDQKELSGPVGFALLISVIQLCAVVSKYIWVCILHRKKKQQSLEILLDVSYTELLVKNDDKNINNTSQIYTTKKEMMKRQREIELKLARLKQFELQFDGAN